MTGLKTIMELKDKSRPKSRPQSSSKVVKGIDRIAHNNASFDIYDNSTNFTNLRKRNGRKATF